MRSRGTRGAGLGIYQYLITVAWHQFFCYYFFLLFFTFFLSPFWGQSTWSAITYKQSDSNLKNGRLSLASILFTAGADAKRPKGIYIHSLQTRTFSRAIFLPNNCSNVRVSPTGNSVAFSIGKDQNGGPGLFVAFKKDDKWTWLKLYDQFVIEHEFSPDGNALVFVGGPVRRDIYVAYSPDWVPKPTTDTADRMESQPSWLADGSGLLYVTHNAELGGTPDRICIWHFTTMKESEIYHDPLFSVGSPRQGSPGGHIAFTKWGAKQSPEAEKQTAYICLVPPEGGKAQTLTNLVSWEGSLRWSADGKWISIIGADNTLKLLQRRGKLFLINPISGEVHKLGERVDSYCWLPDGLHIVLSQGAPGNRRLVLFNLQSEKKQSVGFKDRDSYGPQYWIRQNIFKEE